MDIRELTPADAAAFQLLRLAGLRECPSAFASSYEEECDRPIEDVAARLAASNDGFVLGAISSGELVGVSGLYRERHHKMRHRATIWGVYVLPKARRTGIGRVLIESTVARGGKLPGVMQLNLGVNSRNHSAIALYESLGFKTYATEIGYLLIDDVLHDELLMGKWLVTSGRGA